MTTRYVNRCSVDGCPEPNSEIWHRCHIDSCQKVPIHHHHFPSRAQAGKGAEIVAALCPKHHDMISLNKWHEGVYTHPDGSKRYYVQNTKGEQQCERIIEEALAESDWEQGEREARQDIEAGRTETFSTFEEAKAWLESPEEESPPPDEPREALIHDGTPAYPPLQEMLQLATDDNLPAVQEPAALSSLTDEQLATMFQEGDSRQAEGFLLKCRVVQAYRERHIQAWGESWLENAYELFHVSRRTLFAYANIGHLVDKADTYLVENIGPLTSSKSLMTHIGRKALPDGKVALEEAVTYLAEFGEPPTVPALEHRLGVETMQPEVCPESGGPHVFFCECGKRGKP